MLIYLIIIFSIYFAFLLMGMAGWRKFMRYSKPSASMQKKFVSVVVAVRNEEATIHSLLESLRFQDFPHDRFEVIFVDDHSTDGSHQLLVRWMKENPQIQGAAISSTGHGKKQALATGINQAKGEIIITTDSDCVLPLDWISCMVMSFATSTSMVIGLVKIHQDESFFSKLQAIEFNSVMGSGVALHALGFPIMCNGASLAFLKERFDLVKGYEGNLHIPSGDDEFLMRKLHQQFPGSIQTSHWSSVVTTQAQPSLKNFIQQRLRWAGKWKANDSLLARLVALFILVFQISYLTAFGFIMASTHALEFGVLLGLKILLEARFLFLVSKTLNQRFSSSAFLFLQIVYPFYVLLIGVFSQLLDYEWKGRVRKSHG